MTKIESMQAYCNQCNANVLAQRQVEEIEISKTNHILHLLLSIFTGGIWIPMWILIAITGSFANAVRALIGAPLSYWHCTKCGREWEEVNKKQRKTKTIRVTVVVAVVITIFLYLAWC